MMKKGINVFISLCCMMMLIGCQVGEEKEETKDPVQEPIVQQKEKVSLTLSFVGDITLGNYAGQGYDGTFDAEYDKQGKDPTYFLKNVKDIFEADDLTVANLEGPLTTVKEHKEKSFPFGGNPDYVKILTSSGIDVVTLANNHSLDRYQQGLDDTRELLTNHQIGHFGYAYEYIAEVKGIKIGFLGYAFPANISDSMKEAITSLKEKTDILIVYYHWGIERDYHANDGQVNLAHETIDLGADLVLGAHPHVLQNTETYKGKKIIYSLGNFCFGGNKNPSDKDTAIYQHTFVLEDKEIIEESNHIIPCSISSTTSRNNYQPKVVEGKQAERILSKMKEKE